MNHIIINHQLDLPQPQLSQCQPLQLQRTTLMEFNRKLFAEHYYLTRNKWLSEE